MGNSVDVLVFLPGQPLNCCRLHANESVSILTKNVMRNDRSDKTPFGKDCKNLVVCQFAETARPVCAEQPITVYYGMKIVCHQIETMRAL